MSAVLPEPDDDGITRCPAGIAHHAHDLATRGTGILCTCWPNPRNQLPPLAWNHVRGIPLWQQEMAILINELSPRIAALLHWEKLWKALEEIPIEQAIENDAPKRTSFAEHRATIHDRVWNRQRKASVYKSVFCTHEECARCKQIDCDCNCHAVGKAA